MGMPSMNTKDAVEAFLVSCRSKGLSRETVRWYRGILSKFNQQFNKMPRKAEEIEGFLVSCRVGDERRHGYYRTLRCFYRFLNRRYNIKNLMLIIDPPKRRRKEPKILMPIQLNQLLASTMPDKIKAAILFLVDTGARLGELANLNITDLEDTPWGHTARITGKTGTRIIPISYEAYHAMMVNLPFTVSKHRLGILISRACKKAGVNATAHTFRHTFGTLWQGDEMVLQRIMGHSNLSTTRLYRHLQTQILSEQHSQYSPLKMLLSASKNML